MELSRARIFVVLFLSILITGSASLSRTTIEATNLCHDDCILKDVVLDFPQTADGFADFDFAFAVEANMSEDMSFAWRHQITVVTGPAHLNVEVWNSTGVPCGYTFVGDPVWLQMFLYFPDCHARAGRVKMLGGVYFHGAVLPGVPVQAHVAMWNGQGYQALDMQIQLSHPLFGAAPLSIPEVMPKQEGKLLRQLRDADVGSDDVESPSSTSFPRTEISAKSCCDETCALKNLSLNFPRHLDGFGMNFSVSGQFLQSMSDIRYGIHGVLGVLNVAPEFTVLLANGSACGYTTIGDHTEFTIGLDPGMCPFAAGAYTLSGWTRFTLPFDWLGNVTLRVEISEENSDQRVGCVDVNLHVGFGKEMDMDALPPRFAPEKMMAFV